MATISGQFFEKTVQKRLAKREPHAQTNAEPHQETGVYFVDGVGMQRKPRRHDQTGKEQQRQHRVEQFAAGQHRIEQQQDAEAAAQPYRVRTDLPENRDQKRKENRQRDERHDDVKKLVDALFAVEQHCSNGVADTCEEERHPALLAVFHFHGAEVAGAAHGIRTKRRNGKRCEKHHREQYPTALCRKRNERLRQVVQNQQKKISRQQQRMKKYREQPGKRRIHNNLSG